MTTPSITDHAVLRWLERVQGIDIAKVRADIAKACEFGMPDPEGEIHFGKGRIVLKNNTVVTILPTSGVQAKHFRDAWSDRKARARPRQQIEDFQ